MGFMETTQTLPNGYEVPLNSLTAAKLLLSALQEADRWTSSRLAEAWASVFEFRTETVNDPSRFGELHTPGALVVQNRNVHIALRTVDGWHEMVSPEGVFSILPSWEDYDLYWDGSMTFVYPG